MGGLDEIIEVSISKNAAILTVTGYAFDTIEHMHLLQNYGG
jgi:hypothetical protein